MKDPPEPLRPLTVRAPKTVFRSLQVCLSPGTCISPQDLSSVEGKTGVSQLTSEVSHFSVFFQWTQDLQGPIGQRDTLLLKETIGCASQ